MLDCSLNKMKLLDFFAELLALANHSVFHTFEKNITAFLPNHESFLASEKFYSHCFIYIFTNVQLFYKRSVFIKVFCFCHPSTDFSALAMVTLEDDD